MNYRTYLIFYFLEFMGATVNLCGSLVRFYPKLELGLSYLMRKEGRSVQGELNERQTKREKQERKALSKLEEAKRLSNE